MYFMVNTVLKLVIFSIDATAESGHLGRLVNHSRTESNARMHLFTIEDKPRLALLANKAIRAGEEILYDYGERDKLILKANSWLSK